MGLFRVHENVSQLEGKKELYSNVKPTSVEVIFLALSFDEWIKMFSIKEHNVSR